MKKAHIVSRPNHEVGDKVMTVCGKKHKVTQLWDDISEDNPVCRACINGALVALTEADKVIESARRRGRVLARMSDALDNELGEFIQLDAISAVDLAYQDELNAKAVVKGEKKRAKQTCTCTWESPEVQIVDPECPVHKTMDDAEITTTDAPVQTPGSVQRTEVEE